MSEVISFNDTKRMSTRGIGLIDLRERIQMLDQTSESWFSQGSGIAHWVLFVQGWLWFVASIILFNRFSGRCG